MTVTPSVPLSAALADRVVEAVLGCPDVVAMSGGRLGEVATYLPGRRVVGVRAGEDRSLTVHVAGRYGPALDELAAQVRAAVLAVAGPRTIHVGVDDLVVVEQSP